MPTPTRQRAERPPGPTKNHSRHFDASDVPNSSRSENYQARPEPEEKPASRPPVPRSTSYTSPLPLGDRSELKRSSAPLTRENLQALLRGLEKNQKSAPPSLDSGSVRHPGERGPAKANIPSSNHHQSQNLQSHMPKTKSPKKSTNSRKSKPDPDSHPLNLPPDELRRLSAAMAREEARNATPMDLDDQPETNGTSQPPTPGQEAPGAFPEEQTNGVNGEEPKSPTPPPHKPQPVDAETCKAAGNKYFKAKDYDRAVQEYSKGEQTIFPTKYNSNHFQLSKQNHRIPHTSPTVLRPTFQPESTNLLYQTP